jgi:hypothetical protein
MTITFTIGVAVPEKLTLNDLFALFGCSPEDTRWVGSADSAEYLTVVTYLVQRSNRAQA